MSRIPSLGPRGEGWTTLQAVVMIAILVAARWGDGATPDIPATADLLALVGWIAFTAAMLVLGWSVWLLYRAEALTALPFPVDSGAMVASGPYRLVRHPIYASLVLASAGVAAFRYSLATLALAIALFVILDLKRRREEAWLSDRYPGYAAYGAQTKALVPFVY